MTPHRHRAPADAPLSIVLVLLLKNAAASSGEAQQPTKGTGSSA